VKADAQLYKNLLAFEESLDIPGNILILKTFLDIYSTF